MMAENKIDDGGSAFPFEGGENNGISPEGGMTLRDWFAGQCLVAMGTWAPVEPAEWPHRDVVQKMRAEFAYEQADAMIAARKGGA